jgi:hypothetical protein
MDMPLHPPWSAVCRYCCKSPKLPGANFLAVKKSDRRPRIDVASITLPRSPASLSSGNEVPHIFTRKSCVQPKEILITSAKRLLQQNRHLAAYSQCGGILKDRRHHASRDLTKPHIGLEILLLRRFGLSFARPLDALEHGGVCNL